MRGHEDVDLANCISCLQASDNTLFLPACSDGLDMRTIGSVLWPKLRLLQIYGANTEVGKTIFASILSRAFRKRVKQVNYLKPVSTGPLDEADDR